jgi:uncharacterized membrane protein
VTESEGDNLKEQNVSSELERLAEALQVDTPPRNGRDDVQPDDADDASSGSTIAGILLSEKYRGAFIHPDLLHQFDQCIEDGAERAFSLTEREQQHRHALDTQFARAQINLVSAQADKIRSENLDRRLLIVFAFIYFMLVGTGSFVAVMTDHVVGGASVLGGGALIAIAGVLTALARRGQQGKEK